MARLPERLERAPEPSPPNISAVEVEDVRTARALLAVTYEEQVGALVQTEKQRKVRSG